MDEFDLIEAAFLRQFDEGEDDEWLADAEDLAMEDIDALV